MSTRSPLSDDWREGFRARFEERLRLSLNLISKYRAGPGEQTRYDLADCLHKLAGIAGALGYREISDAAREVDVALNIGRAPTDRQLLRLSGRVSDQML